MPVNNPMGKVLQQGNDVLNVFALVKVKEAEVVETQVLLKKDDYL